MKGGSSQPLGTGTTFFNMMDFVQPTSQQQAAAPAAQTPVAQAPAATPAPVASTPNYGMSMDDWLKSEGRYRRGYREFRGNPNGGGAVMHNNMNRKNAMLYNDYLKSNDLTRPTSEMIKQLMGGGNGS